MPVTVVTSGEVNVASVGEYIITYTATDNSGNTATATRTVNVVDTTIPTIVLSGDRGISFNHEARTDET